MHQKKIWAEMVMGRNGYGPKYLWAEMSRNRRLLLRISPVTSGVPQCSVLGPLLFLPFINDLPSRVKSRTSMFADDCLLYRTIKGQADAHALQKDLDSLQDWEKEWQMEFNADKCEVIRITSKKNPILLSI